MVVWDYVPCNITDHVARAKEQKHHTVLETQNMANPMN